MTSLGIVANLSKRQVAPQNISESSETESLPLANQIDYSTQDFTGCDAKACKKECNPNQETFEGDSYPYIKLHPVYCGILAQNRILQNKPNHRTAKSFKSRFLSSKSFVMNMKNTEIDEKYNFDELDMLFDEPWKKYNCVKAARMNKRLIHKSVCKEFKKTCFVLQKLRNEQKRLSTCSPLLVFPK